MFPKIFDTICIVSINIYISLINVNNKPASNICAFLNNSGNNSNNYKRDQKNDILAKKC